MDRYWRFLGVWPVRDILTTDGDLYLRRIYLPWAGYLHKIARADDDRHLHNHPWEWAETRILSGGYLEQRDGECFWRMPGDVVRIEANTFHRIMLVLPGTWTYFRRGPRIKRWGFRVLGTFVESERYFALRNIGSMPL